MNKEDKKIITIVLISVIIIAISIFAFRHIEIEIKYTPFKTCEVGTLNLTEDGYINANFTNLGIAWDYCKSNCKFSFLLDGGVGANSAGFYCTYR